MSFSPSTRTPHAFVKTTSKSLLFISLFFFFFLVLIISYVGMTEIK